MLTILDPDIISSETEILQDLADFGIVHLSPQPAHGWNYILDHVWVTKEIDIYMADRQLQDPVILDVGCGRSLYHEFLESRLHNEIVGIERPFGYGHVGEMKNVDHYEDFLSLDVFSENAVDIILWLSSIEHNELEVMQRLVQKSIRLLKDGGLFLATIGISESTYWFNESEQTNLSISDGQAIFDEDEVIGDFYSIREKYSRNALFLREKYQSRYGEFHQNGPEFIVAGIKKVRNSSPHTQRVKKRSVATRRRERTHVLVYIEPMPVLDRPYRHKWWWHFAHRIITTLNNDEANEYSFRIVTSEPIRTQIPEKQIPENVGIATISYESLLKQFYFDYYRASMAWYTETYSEEQLQHAARLLREALAEWTPDIVITFSPIPFANEAYPDAIVLHHEYGITSRPPFPETFYLDPEGYYKDSYLIKNLSKIRTSPISDSERESLGNYRTHYLELIERHNPFKGFLEKAKNDYENLLLVPLQASRTYWFDGNCDFTSQFQFVQYVLSNVPADYGVICSPHPDYPSLTPDIITYLRTTYRNFIYSPEFENVQASSQYILGHVDAVISVSSMVALQALIWKKKIISIGTGQARLVADAEDLNEIRSVLARVASDRDNVLSWLLTRYYFTGRYSRDPIWLSRFLHRALDHYRKGIPYDSLFEAIDDADAVLDGLIEDAIPNIPIRSWPSQRDEQLEAVRKLVLEREETIETLQAQRDRLKTTLAVKSQEFRETRQLQEDKLVELRQVSLALKKERDRLFTRLGGSENKLESLKDQLGGSELAIASLRQKIRYLLGELEAIQNSDSLKAARMMTRLRDRIAPYGSGRERILRLPLVGLKTWRREGLRSSVRLVSGRIVRRVAGKTPHRLMPKRLLGKADAIEESGLFDVNWYLTQNPDVRKAGIDPLEHYLRYGAAEGRTPNPLFNTMLYVSAHGGRIVAENALIHFHQSDQIVAPGAYRSPDVLASIQSNVRANTKMHLIENRRLGEKRFALYLQCGSGSIHEQWLRDRPRSWDLIVNHFDGTYIGKIPCDIEFQQVGSQPGTKSTSFFCILTEWARMINQYDYILLLDDDISIEEAAVGHLFDIAKENSLDLAQASLSLDSYCAHAALRNRGADGLRPVNAVEIMMPLLSRRALRTGAHVFGQTISGWGLDLVLGKLVADQFQGKIAVIDDVIAQHVRPIDTREGALYRMLNRAQIYPEIELTHLQRIYGTGREIREI